MNYTSLDIDKLICKTLRFYTYTLQLISKCGSAGLDLIESLSFVAHTWVRKLFFL